MLTSHLVFVEKQAAHHQEAPPGANTGGESDKYTHVQTSFFSATPVMIPAATVCHEHSVWVHETGAITRYVTIAFQDYPFNIVTVIYNHALHFTGKGIRNGALAQSNLESGWKSWNKIPKKKEAALTG